MYQRSIVLNPLLRTCKQTAQITNNSTAASTEVPGLAFTVRSGSVYLIEFMIAFQSAATTTGLALLCTAPAQTFGYWTCRMQQGASGTDQFFEQSGGTSFGSTAVSSAVVAADTTYIAVAKGVIKPSADGTVQLKARTEVDASTITVLNQGVGLAIDLGA